MRALLFQYGTHGDVRPLVDIGSALRERGHEVVVGVNPRFEKLVAAASLTFEPIGSSEEYVAVIENPDLWHPSRGMQLLLGAVFGADLRRQVDAVARHRSDSDCVIVAGTWAVGAALAGEKLELPVVRVQAQPSIFFGPHEPPVLPSCKRMTGPLWLRRALLGLLEKTVMRRSIGKPLDAARAELGLTPWNASLTRVNHAGDRNLCLFPSWFAHRTPDWPDNAEHVGFFVDPPEGEAELTSELDEFIERDPSPIVFTPGPAGYQHSVEFFTAAAAACALSNQRGIFVTRGLQLDIDLPDTIRVCRYVPFARLFPRVRMVVHHGGIGTVAHALTAGCPQLVTPFGFDQPDNAWRVRALGAGDLLAKRELSGPALAKKIEALLNDPGLGAACEKVKALAASEQTAPVQRACELIEWVL